jgi:hypothetical protein
MDTEGTSTHASACREADRCEFEIENLRSRLAAKSPKTLDDIAALAVRVPRLDNQDQDAATLIDAALCFSRRRLASLNWPKNWPILA